MTRLSYMTNLMSSQPHQKQEPLTWLHAGFTIFWNPNAKSVQSSTVYSVHYIYNMYILLYIYICTIVYNNIKFSQLRLELSQKMERVQVQDFVSTEGSYWARVRHISFDVSSRLATKDIAAFGSSKDCMQNSL